MAIMLLVAHQSSSERTDIEVLGSVAFERPLLSMRVSSLVNSLFCPILFL
jgi:hypothetical protein